MESETTIAQNMVLIATLQDIIARMEAELEIDRREPS
jgi:hypothetical protein